MGENPPTVLGDFHIVFREMHDPASIDLNLEVLPSEETLRVSIVSSSENHRFLMVSTVPAAVAPDKSNVASKYIHALPRVHVLWGFRRSSARR